VSIISICARLWAMNRPGMTAPILADGACMRARGKLRQVWALVRHASNACAVILWHWEPDSVVAGHPHGAEKGLPYIHFFRWLYWTLSHQASVNERIRSNSALLLPPGAVLTLNSSDRNNSLMFDIPESSCRILCRSFCFLIFIPN
jgi:hypothetical protein